MVTSPTGKSIIAMGGGKQSSVFELSESMEWNPIKQCLQYDHSRPVAIPIPNELAYEKVDK